MERHSQMPFVFILCKWSSCKGALTLGLAGDVVPVQTVARSAETDVRSIWNLSAEMFASSVSVATAAGGGTCCVDSGDENTTLFVMTETSATATITNARRNVYLCHSCVRGNQEDICRCRCRSGEYRSLRSYRETTGSDSALRTGCR